MLMAALYQHKSPVTDEQMDNEHDTCQAKGCDTFRCETNNPTQSQAVVRISEMWGNVTPGQAMPVIHQ